MGKEGICMKQGFFCLSLLLCLSVFAGEVKLSNPAGKRGKNNVAKGWYLNGYAGYKPAPSLAYPEGEKVLHVYDIKGKSGVGFCHAGRFPVREGDRVLVRAKVKGRGKVWFGIQVYNNKRWLGCLPDKTQDLTGEYREVKMELPAVNISSLYSTNNFMFTFGTRKNSELWIRDLKVEVLEKDALSGNLPFPVKWHVFLPVAKDFKPAAADLLKVPSRLGSVKGRPVLMSGSELDLAPLFGNQKTGNCAWLYTVLDSPAAQAYTISGGADWWMTLYVNGKVVLDTSKKGNHHHPPRMTDHKGIARLKKGRNIIAVRFVSGRSSSRIALAGPLELKARSNKMRIVQVLAKDEFEKARVRTGNPVLIQDHPTPGLLVSTGQAVYNTVKPLVIALEKSTVQIPDLTSNRYLGSGMRIQSFGKTQRVSSVLKMILARQMSKENVEVCFLHDAKKEQIQGKVFAGKKECGSFAFPYRVLPADVMFSVNGAGNALLSVASLADSSYQAFSFALPAEMVQGPLRTNLLFASSSGKKAQFVMDNYQNVLTAPEVMRNLIPVKLNVQKSFDPVKEGWKLVFSDEFNGKSVDYSKWYVAQASRKNVTLDGKGFLEVRAAPRQKGKGLLAGSLRSRKQFKYGYFEAKVRFTKNPDWWSFVFLYSSSVGNPMIDGMEIDVYEDYYMAGKGNRTTNVLDHNLHCYVGGILKSWNYNSVLPGKAEDFYVIGVKWTPFEISYYLNGKLIKSSANHSPHQSVTFDAVNHANGTAPLDLRIGCNILSHARGKNNVSIPEVYKADYVRVYAYPTDKAPSVRWTMKNYPLVVRPGEKFDLEVIAAPSVKTKAPIKGAYLFDGGHIIGYKARPPYRFTVDISPKGYEGNAYLRGGRTGNKPELGALHGFSVMVQDELGNCADSPVVLKFPLPAKKSRPYKGKAQVIPGVVNPSFFDEGGNGVGYYDDKINRFSKKFRPSEGVDTSGKIIGQVLTGEWVRVTVEVKEAGTYKAVLNYGTPAYGKHKLMMLMDDRHLGDFIMTRHKGDHWAADSYSTLENLKLPAGQHVITLICAGGFNFGEITFTRTGK